MKLYEEHPDRPGWYYDVRPIAFGKWRLMLTDGAFADDVW